MEEHLKKYKLIYEPLVHNLYVIDCTRLKDKNINVLLRPLQLNNLLICINFIEINEIKMHAYFM